MKTLILSNTHLYSDLDGFLKSNGFLPRIKLDILGFQLKRKQATFFVDQPMTIRRTKDNVYNHHLQLDLWGRGAFGRTDRVSF